MGRQPLISREEIRRLAFALLILVLLAAAANVPFAVSLVRSRSAPRMIQAAPLRGQGVPSRWPSSTPHEQPWPNPDYWIEYHEFGFRLYDARTIEDGQGRFVMNVERYGWPLAALEMKAMWWDWNDPSLKGPESNPAPAILASGLILNPLLVGAALWALIPGLPFAFFVIRRAWRRQGGQCVRCGYPIGVSAQCSECGSPVRACATGAGRRTMGAT